MAKKPPAPRLAPTTDDVKTIDSIRDLETDQHNANPGTPRGVALLETSVRRNGIGRSVLADKHGRLIAGNKTTETIADVMGTEIDVIVIKTDGTKLIVHQRTDLDLDTDPRARELAIAENRVAEVGLAWDTDILKDLDATPGVDLSQYWTPTEFNAMQADDAARLVTLTVERPTEVAWILLAIPLADWPAHQPVVEALQAAARFSAMVLRPAATSDAQEPPAHGE